MIEDLEGEAIQDMDGGRAGKWLVGSRGEEYRFPVTNRAAPALHITVSRSSGDTIGEDDYKYLAF